MTTWGAPGWLGALGLVALAAAIAGGWVVGALQQHREFAPDPLWKKMRVRPDWPEFVVRLGLVLLAMALVVVALADPLEPGARTEARQPGRLLILLDLSRSMRAQDALSDQRQPTSRFSAARALLRDLPDFLPGWQMGLVVFAADPMVLCPTTRDVPALLTLLEHARPGDPAMHQGTDIEQALTAGTALLGNRPGAILLLTDGEQLTGHARHAIGLLRSRHIPVYAVGLGLTGGTPLFRNDNSPLTWDGLPVRSARHDRLLRDLASETGGRYFPSRGELAADGLEAAKPPTALFVASNLRAPTGAPRSGGASERDPLLVASWVLLMVDGLLLLRTTRPRARVKPGSLAPIAACALLIGLSTFAQMLLGGWTWPSWNLTRRAARAYDQGHLATSVALLEQADRQDPGNGLVKFDLANGLLRSHHTAQALSQYQAALLVLPTRSILAEHAWYNLGNGRFETRDIAGAAACFRHALALDPRDADAAHNLALCVRPPEPASGAAAPSKGARSRPRSAAATGPSPPPDANRLLQALQDDEHLRAKIAAQRAEQARKVSSDDPSAIARQMLEAARRSVGQPNQREW